MDQDEDGREPHRATARKRELRAAARAARRSADPAAREALGGAWAVPVTRIASGARTVAVYVAYGTEPPTAPLIDALVADGVRVLVPILLEDRDLDWADHAHPEVALGRDAIAEADVVVLPALRVGLDGARLGQGGGSYDRALTRVRPGTPLVALVHDDEVADVGEIPTEPHDMRATVVVTPTRVVEIPARFGGESAPGVERADGDLPVDPELPLAGERGETGSSDGFDVALAVAAGGALGAVARWGLDEALPRSGGGFPWATFVENVGGAFLLGVLVIVLLHRRPHRYARPFLAVGVLGGFTTFSTYVADVRQLTDDGHAATALAYLVLTLAVGLAASVAGIAAGRALSHRRQP